MNNKCKNAFYWYYHALKNRFAALNFPRKLIWFVTERCNLNCPHCFVNTPSHKKREEMPVDQAVRFIKNSHLSYITFTGGEPALYPGFEQLIQASLDSGIGVGVSSNGYRSRELLNFLRKIGKTIYFQVSLDGDKQTHNNIRGNAQAYDDAIELISLAKQGGHRVVVVFTVSSKNITSLESVLQLCAKNRWPIYINFIRSSDQAGAFADNSFIPEQKNDLSVEEMQYCYRLWREHAQGYMSRLDRIVMASKTEQVINFIKHGSWSYKCAAGINDAVMYPNGEIAFCETRKTIGNLQDFNLDWREFWRGRQEQLKACFCQWDCAMIYSLTYSFTGMRFFLKYFTEKPLRK